jgi:hypothetical protein
LAAAPIRSPPRDVLPRRIAPRKLLTRPRTSSSTSVWISIWEPTPLSDREHAEYGDDRHREGEIIDDRWQHDEHAAADNLDTDHVHRNNCGSILIRRIANISLKSG